MRKRQGDEPEMQSLVVTLRSVLCVSEVLEHYRNPGTVSAVGSGPLDTSPSQGEMSLSSLHLSTYFSESPDFALHFMQRLRRVAVGRCPKLCELSVTKGISAYMHGEEVLTSSQESTPIHLHALTHTCSHLHTHAHM